MRSWHQAWLGSVVLFTGTTTHAAQDAPPTKSTVAGAVRSAMTMASGAPVELNIEAQPIGDALNEFGRQTGLHVVLYSALGKGLHSPRLVGSYTVSAALARLLENSGLRYEPLDDRTVAILPLSGATAENADDAATDYPPARPAGGAEAGERLRLAQAPTQSAAQPGEASLEEVVVTSKVVFTQNDAFGATKMGLAVKDTPQTVMVVTSDMMDFSGMRSFNDFYNLDPSGGPDHTTDGYPRNYYRGFRQQGNNAIRVDGFRMPGNIDLDLATFDRFEVIKGPTSTLYGQNSIAGTLNAVSKVPQQRFGTDLRLEAGEFGDYRLDADVTGSLAGQDAWSYRLIGAYQDGDTFFDFSGERRKLLSASLQYAPSDATRFILATTYQKNRITMQWGSPLQLAGNGTADAAERARTEGLKIPDVPRSRYYGMPWNYADTEAMFVRLQGEHTFGNDWKLRAHAQYSDLTRQGQRFSPTGPYDQDGFAYWVAMYGNDEQSGLYGGEINLFGTVEALGREHTLFFGVDHSEIRKDQLNGYEDVSFGYEDSAFNIFAPDYTAFQPHASVREFSGRDDYGERSELSGATVQAILNPADKVRVLIGGRYSRDTLFSRIREGAVPGGSSGPYTTIADVDFEELVYQAGLTYELTPALNLYASYGETFDPKTDRVFVEDDPAGRLIAPEKGLNYEIGLKGGPSRELSFGLALFQMERTNISQADVLHPGYSVAIGTQRSRGVELTTQGRVTPAFNVFASVAYLDAQFTEGEYAGLQPANAPKFGASVFGSYEILNGGLKGLGFGFGVVHKSGRTTFDQGWSAAPARPVNFDFGSFTEVDGRIFYSRDRWMYALEATNLFDEKYYSSAFTYLRTGVEVNPPRMLRASLRYRF